MLDLPKCLRVLNGDMIFLCCAVIVFSMYWTEIWSALSVAWPVVPRWILCILGIVPLLVCWFTWKCACIVFLYVSVCVTNCCMIYSFFLWCCCLGPSVCHANAQRSLCNCSGPLKAPCHMDPSSLGSLSVHPSIAFNCLEPGFCTVTIYLAVSS